MDLKDTVVLGENDIKMVEDFFSHYNDPKTNNLPMTDLLKKELERFKSKFKNNSYTVEDQKSFTIALCGALAATTHPILKDPAIKDVIAACDEVWTDGQFHLTFEEFIASPGPDPVKR